MRKIITLSGLAGSGKSTIGKLLAKKLDYEFVSIGNFSRKIAKERYNMNINEFQIFCKNHQEFDKEIDTLFSKYCNENEKLIVDYRLGFYFVNDAYNVFLKVSEQEAVNRLFNAKRQDEFGHSSASEIRKTMKKRNMLMINRFLDTYNIDFTIENNYDLVVNTDKYSNFSNIVDIIIKAYSKCTY
jgi:predicted cytidylate kinase